MRLYFTLILMSSMIFQLTSQSVTYERTLVDPIVPLGIVDVQDIKDQYLFNLTNVETQDASAHIIKHKLIDIKHQIDEEYPKKDINPVNTRGDSEPPVIQYGFNGQLATPGVPLDNSLASNGEQVLIAMNNHFAMRRVDGSAIVGFSLDHFAAEVGLEGSTFDPRVVYDPESDRYIGVFLHGFESGDTGIGIMFSQSNDITGEWAVYALPGNPFSNTTWTDYPMINVTSTDLVITVNLIRDNEPWETGFDETILWQLDKAKGYVNEEMNSILWQGIEFNGQNIRNLCPMESADATLESNSYYLSNRNFDIENDTIFFVELSGGIEDADATLSIEALITDVPYGAPPNADQSVGFLQTNDARVLEGFFHNDQIQFVGNTRNPINNKAGIYHGIIRNVSGAKDITLEHIIPEDLEIGYPGITYTGIEPTDLDAIIHFSHTSPIVFAGTSAMYYLPADGYSDIIELKSGDGYIDYLNGDVERWGDYAGSQREFNSPGQCLVSGTIGIATRDHRAWITRLSRPAPISNTEDEIATEQSIEVFPNPVSHRVNFNFNVPDGTKKLRVAIYDASGQVIDVLKNGAVQKTGESTMSFEISHLVPGLYTVSVSSDDRPVLSETFIRE